MKRMFCVSLILLSSLLFAENIVETKIEAVTVYQSQALIKRRGSGNFSAGVHKIVVKNLPQSLINENARAEVLTNSAKILGFKLRNQYDENLRPNQMITQYQNKIDSLQINRQSLQDQLDILAKTDRFVQEVANSATKRMTVENSDFSFEEIERTLNFTKKNYASIKKEYRALEREIAEINSQISVLRNKINTANQVAQSKFSKTMEISFELFEPQKVNFQVSYSVHNAHWTPSYDIFVSEDEKQVALKFGAIINQNSEEDWEDVSLEISTNDPTIDSNIPDFFPRYIDAQYNRLGNRSYADKVASAPAAQELNIRGGRANEVVYEMDGFANQLEQGEYRDRQKIESLLISEAGNRKNYQLKQKVTVNAGNQNEEYNVATEILDISTVHYILPRIAEKAYVKATMKNSSELTFLPGTADLFYANTFVAKVNLPMLLPQEEVDFSLGIDENIKVKFEKIKDEADKGFISNKEIKVLKYQITVENFRSDRADIILLEQAPLARNKDINIAYLEPSVAFEEQSAEDKREGKLTWKFELAPQEQQKIEIGYKIKYD
ncbi:MAG: mucoidy inhibitor MuiA family protein [Candidatus Cloacimonadales bacterium]